MIKLPIIKYIDGAYRNRITKIECKKIYSHNNGIFVLGLYYRRNSILAQKIAEGRGVICVVKQPCNKKQERQTLRHELLHWVVDIFLLDLKILHKCIDKYYGYKVKHNKQKKGYLL